MFPKIAYFTSHPISSTPSTANPDASAIGTETSSASTGAAGAGSVQSPLRLLPKRVVGGSGRSASPGGSSSPNAAAQNDAQTAPGTDRVLHRVGQEPPQTPFRLKLSASAVQEILATLPAGLGPLNLSETAMATLATLPPGMRHFDANPCERTAEPSDRMAALQRVTAVENLIAELRSGSHRRFTAAQSPDIDQMQSLLPQPDHLGTGATASSGVTPPANTPVLVTPVGSRSVSHACLAPASSADSHE